MKERAAKLKKFSIREKSLLPSIYILYIFRKNFQLKNVTLFPRNGKISNVDCFYILRSDMRIIILNERSGLQSLKLKHIFQHKVLRMLIRLLTYRHRRHHSHLPFDGLIEMIIIHCHRNISDNVLDYCLLITHFKQLSYQLTWITFSILLFAQRWDS